MSNNLYYKPDELPKIVRAPTIEERVSMLEQLIKTNTSKMDRMCALLEELCEPVRKASKKEKAEKEKERLEEEYYKAKAEEEERLEQQNDQLIKQIELHRANAPHKSEDYKIWSIELSKLQDQLKEIQGGLGIW
jgi:hypothetical protein